MEKIKKLLKIEFDSKPIYDGNDKYIKAEIKIYAGNIHKNFQGKTMPKEKEPWKCLSIVMLESVITAKKKYCP